MSELGDYIKNYREEHHTMSIRTLAEKCGLSAGYIHKLEKGIDPRTQKNIIPTVETINRLAAGMSVPHEILLNLSGLKSLPNTLGTSIQTQDPELSTKDKKDIARDIDQMRQELLRQRNNEDSDTLLFDGEPMSNESIDQILAALEIGMEMVKKKNKAKYTPKKYQR